MLFMSSISEKLKQIEQKIENCAQKVGRNPEDIRLVAVSKTKPVSDIQEAYDAGQRDFGENRMQELADKMEQLTHQDIQWHMIGTLQRNKIKYIAHRVDWIHSVPAVRHLNEIDKQAAKHNRSINVLIQVNISDEDQKSGCEPEELTAILQHAKKLRHVKVRGLMGMASFSDDMELVGKQFAMLRMLRDTQQQSLGSDIDLSQLSMGMSGDMEVAVKEGSTMLRIGSAIFGERN
jgi:hypothetical protein